MVFPASQLLTDSHPNPALMPSVVIQSGKKIWSVYLAIYSHSLFFFLSLCLGVDKSLGLWKAEWIKHEEPESEV